MFGTHRISWIKILFAFFLIAGLPIFIWAVLTQRIELRKHAATAEPTEICWNRVISFNNAYNWPNSCKGSPRTDLTCTQIIIPLTTEEIAGYQTWVSMGKPYIPGCSGPVPSTAPPPISECGVCSQTTSCASGLVCQYVPTPTPNCPNGPNGPCSIPASYPHQTCVKPDGSSKCAPTPTPVSCGPNGATCTITICPPMPVCPPGTACPQVMPPCTVRPGICQNNRCVPTYPTPTWYPSTTPTQIPTCTRGTPIVSLYPNNQSGNPGQTLTYTANIVNTDSQPCGSSIFTFAGQTDTGFLTQFQYYSMPIPASASAHMNVYITSPTIDPYPDTRSLPISFSALNTATNLSAKVYAAYTLVKPAPQQLKFLVELAGVNGPEAKGATINVKLKLQNGTVLPLDKPLVLDSVGNGVYSATATLTNPLPAGTALRVLVKGEKHSQVVFCRTSGQTGPCNDTEYMTPSSYSFDFTGRPLPAGDLNQDGKVNTDDLKFITDLFKKPSTQLTAQDLKSADVDYSGTIDAYDLNLVLQTLETRYDEQ